MSENEATNLTAIEAFSVRPHCADFIGRRGIKITPTGLEISHDLSLGDWCEFGRDLIKSGNIFHWAIGDWAQYGDEKFGKLEEFAAANNINESYLKELAWVSRRVMKAIRRSELSHQHHREVAVLTDTKQQELALGEIVKNHMTVPQTRCHIRQSSGKENALESDGIVFRMVGTKFDEVKGFLLNQPQDWWDDEKRKIWKERLKPVVEFYQNL